MDDSAVPDLRHVIEMRGSALPKLANGESALRLVGIQGSEALSRLYSYTLDCVTPPEYAGNPGEVDNLCLSNMTGSELTVSIRIEGLTSTGGRGHPVREISGIVTEAHFEDGGEGAGVIGS